MNKIKQLSTVELSPCKYTCACTHTLFLQKVIENAVDKEQVGPQGCGSPSGFPCPPFRLAGWEVGIYLTQSPEGYGSWNPSPLVRSKAKGTDRPRTLGPSRPRSVETGRDVSPNRDILRIKGSEGWLGSGRSRRSPLPQLLGPRMPDASLAQTKKVRSWGGRQRCPGRAWVVRLPEPRTGRAGGGV